jgi:hypothetical protein
VPDHGLPLWPLCQRPTTAPYSLYLCCEPEPLTLFGPGERHRTKESFQGCIDKPPGTSRLGFEIEIDEDGARH